MNQVTQSPAELARPLPRPLRSAARSLVANAEALARRGTGVECPCCNGRFRAFASHRGVQNRRCPRCSSLPRHRILFLYLRDHYVIEQRLRILHLAPERGLHRHLKHLPGYAAGDICPGTRVTHVFDVQEIPFSSDTFDFILCSHVLEHVENDRAALAEFRRVLAPRGQAILQHPIKLSLATTFEDPTITSPAARREAFGQHDHVRLYGADFGNRLREAGFEFEVLRYTDRLPPSAISWYGLNEEGGINGSDLYIAR